MAQKILLDTCTFLWLVRDDSSLSCMAVLLTPDHAIIRYPVNTQW